MNKLKELKDGLIGYINKSTERAFLFGYLFFGGYSLLIYACKLVLPESVNLWIGLLIWLVSGLLGIHIAEELNRLNEDKED